MININFKTTDLRWAIAYAGAIIDAKHGTGKSVNPPFDICFSGTNPEIIPLARSFSTYDESFRDFPQLVEENYPTLDYFSAQQHAVMLREQHGIDNPPQVVPLYLNALASTSLFLTAGIQSKPSYFYPKLSKSVLASYSKYDAIAEPGYERLAKVFLEGAGVKDPSILTIDNSNLMESIGSYFLGPMVLVAKPNHVLQYIARSQYDGYDNLASQPAVLSIIDNTITSADRYLVSWMGQIPAYINEQEDQIRQKGVNWSIRVAHNFDHRSYIRSVVKSK